MYGLRMGITDNKHGAPQLNLKNRSNHSDVCTPDG